jgi:Fe-S cluster assembly protein SufD
VLLSPKAKVRTRPQLEIYADDVKCSHGATTGQLDETALFYLQQRGIPLREAQRLLLQAFLDEVVMTLPDEALQDEIRQQINKRLD